MKIAILGAGPAGLQAAYYFHKLGAHLTVFEQSTVGGTLAQLSQSSPSMKMEGSWEELVMFPELLGEKNLSETPTVSDFFTSYIQPLAKELGPYIKLGAVLRCHKRFLTQDESVENKSRLHDLFRVVYSSDKTESFRAQLEENPDVFKNIDETIVESLKTAVEGYEDFDLVIDATGVLGSSHGMGPSQAAALNELNLKNENPIYYGFDSFNHLDELKNNSQTLAIVGSGLTAGLLMLELKEWAQKDNHRLFVISTEKDLFSHIPFHLHDEIKEFIDDETEVWKKKCLEKEKEIREWRAKEDYIRAKIPMPTMPESHLSLITGSNVTSVDRLLDQEGLFLTCERAAFRSAGERDELTTIPVQGILVATGYSLNIEIYQGMQTSFIHGNKRTSCEFGSHPEPGLFTLGATAKHSDRYTLKDVKEQIKMIEVEIMKFFSPV